jgi:hypothetical protein
VLLISPRRPGVHDYPSPSSTLVSARGGGCLAGLPAWRTCAMSCVVGCGFGCAACPISNAVHAIPGIAVRAHVCLCTHTSCIAAADSPLDDLFGGGGSSLPRKSRVSLSSAGLGSGSDGSDGEGDDAERDARNRRASPGAPMSLDGLRTLAGTQSCQFTPHGPCCVVVHGSCVSRCKGCCVGEVVSRTDWGGRKPC